MLLSDVAPRLRLQLVRDASFANLGFLSAPLPEMLAFAENERFLHSALRLDAVAALITPTELAEHVPTSVGLALTDNPRLAFSELHNYLALHTDFYVRGDRETQIAADASVHPQASVASSGVVIGAGCKIAAHASVLDGSSLGENVILHEGVVVAGVGLQVEDTGNGNFDLEHAGRVEIADGVRIMGNSIIARGLFRQATVIGRNVRIGNLSFISHNVVVGQDTVIGHGVTINGNVTVGSGVWVGPGATIANGVTIGDRAHVSLGSVVVRNVPAGARVSGNFSVDHRTFLRRQSRRRSAEP